MSAHKEVQAIRHTLARNWNFQVTMTVRTYQRHEKTKAFALPPGLGRRLKNSFQIPLETMPNFILYGNWRKTSQTCPNQARFTLVVRPIFFGRTGIRIVALRSATFSRAPTKRLGVSELGSTEAPEVARSRVDWPK